MVPEGVAVSSPLRRSSSQRVRSWRRSRLAWFQPCQHTSEAAPVNTARDPKAKSLCWGWVAWFQAAKRADPGQRPGRELLAARVGPPVQREGPRHGPLGRDDSAAGDGSSRTSTSIIGSLAAASRGVGTLEGWG